MVNTKENCDMLINSILYDITDKGDLIRGKSWMNESTISHLTHLCKLYDDLKHLSDAEIRRRANMWLNNNERKMS